MTAAHYEPGGYPDLTRDVSCPAYGRPSWIYTVLRLAKYLELGQVGLRDMDYWHLQACEAVWAERARRARAKALEVGKTEVRGG